MAFSPQKVRFKAENGCRAPTVFCARPCLAPHPSLLEARVSPEVCSGRSTYVRWLCEARSSLGFCVLDFMVTSNDVQLLVKDNAEGLLLVVLQRQAWHIVL
jgi:hypothetical protein